MNNLTTDITTVLTDEQSKFFKYNIEGIYEELVSSTDNEVKE